ncbi:MAG TPA: hypothetical protein VN776_07195, partial [Terracidiphilus sp.]|nr:hypothetical protein [Terracidiphilus sp.]
HSGSGLVLNLAAADCAIRVNGRGTIQGGSVGAGATSFQIVPASGHTSFVMDSAFCTDQNSGYVRQEGGLKTSNPTGTPAFTYGTSHIRNVVDHSTFNMLETSSPSDDGALIESACCGANFFSLHADSGNAGGYPIIIGAGGVLKNACTTSGSTTITVPYGHLTAKYLGDTVTAGTSSGVSNLPGGATIVTAINSFTSMTVSQAATATSGGQSACTTPSLTGGSELTLHLLDLTAPTTTSISLHNLVSNGPGPGLQNVVVTGQTNGANLYTAYLESNSAVDTSTSQLYIGYPAGQVNFNGLYAPGPSNGGTKYGVESDTPYGWCMFGGLSNAGLLDQGVKIPAAPNTNTTYCKGGFTNTFNGTNLLPDTNFKQGSTYWTAPSGTTITSGAGASGDNAFTYTLSTTASGTIYIPVTAAIPNLQLNQTYTLGANINAANMTSGTISVQLCSTATCSVTYARGYASAAGTGVVSTTVNGSSFTGPYFVIVISGVAGSGTLAISEPFLVQGIVPAYVENDLGFGSSTNSGAAFSSVALSGGTPWTSSSSANSQVVTCPPGGTSGQFCGADGAWHTPSTGTVSGVTAGTGLTGGGASGSVTLSLSTPVAVANGGTGAATASANTAFGNFTGSAAAPAFTATTGTGSPVAAVSPTFTGNTTTFANNSASANYVVIQPGNSSNAELGGIQLNSAAATPVTEWYLEEDPSYNLKIHDQGATNPIDVFTAYVNGQTVINSQGTAAVAVNNTSNSGTGGFVVYEGGSNYNTAAFTVTSAGNASVPGTWTQKGITDETSAVAGGLVYNSSTSQQASSGLLTQYGLVYGGGASASPASMAACGANFPVVGQASAAPACSTIGWLSSATQWGIPYMSTATQMSTTAAMTNQALIRGNSSAPPTSSSVYDNGTDVFTTEPLYSSSGSTTLTPATGIGTTATSTGVAFPATYGSIAHVYRGRCHIVWQQIAAVSTVTFSIGNSVAPTAEYIDTTSYTGSTPVLYPTGGTPLNITSTTTTAVSSAMAPSNFGVDYHTDIDLLGSFTAAANAVTVYATSGSATDTVSIEPGSYCTWLP